MADTAAPDASQPDYEILQHLVGITTAELDLDHPADLMLAEITKHYVRARDDATHYALRIARDMRRAYEEHPRYRDHAMLAESSDSRRYDEAIATAHPARPPLRRRIHLRPCPPHTAPATATGSRAD